MPKKRATRLPDPEDVLAGRVRVRADELFALVHDVNPTGEESPRERERYALKSRLQGLLLTRFGDEVEVVPDPTNSDLVSLRHRSGLRDACHALVSQLPVEARALVRRRLDAGEGGADGVGPVPTGPSAGQSGPPARASAAAGNDDPGDAASLEARGLAALEEYDYEDAQRLLTAAVERRASPAAARALLELLVDVLADDAAALGLEGSLDPASRSDPGVRGFLALAAARSGDGDRAGRLVRGLDGPLPARVHATLARAVLDSGDLGRAAAHLSAARTADPASPEAAELEARLERARRDERKPAEEALLALHASGALEAAETSARCLLARWPDAAAGRRVLREIDDARRHERAAVLARDGAAALEHGAFAEAARLLGLALAADPALPDGPQLLDRARRAAAEEADEDAVRRVVEALATGPSLEALVSFADLPAALRARVRATTEASETGLVDELLAVSPAEKPRAAAEAALALGAADLALRAGDAAAALRLVEGHPRTLGRLPRASALEREARAALAAARVAAASASLDPVRAALERDDLDDAFALHGAVRKADLDAEGRARFSDLEASLRERLAARRAARDAEAEAAARRALRLSVSDEPGPADELADVQGYFAAERCRPTLFADNARLAVTESYSDWLFVRVVDVARNEVVRRISLRAPHPVGEHESALVEGDRLTVLGSDLGLVSLDLVSAEVARTASLAAVVPASARVERAILQPGSESAWVETSVGSDRRSVTWLVDTRAGRARSKHAEGPAISIVLLGARSVAVLEDDRRAQLLSADGSSAAAAPPPLPIDLQCAAPAPSGPGLFLAGVDSRGIAPDEELPFEADPLRVLSLEPGPSATHLGPGLDLPGTDGERSCALATARGEGLSFALSLVQDGSRVFTLGPGPELLGSAARVPAETAFFVDADSTRVVAGCWWGDRFAAVPLGRETAWPAWGGPLADRDAYPKGQPLEDDFACRPRSRSVNALSLAIYASLSSLSPREVDRRAAQLVDEAHDGDTIEGVMGALERLDPRPGRARRAEMALLRRFPDHPAATMRTLRHHAGEGRWDLVLAGVRSVPAKSAASLPPHFRHLEAIALARAGELPAALALLDGIGDDPQESGCETGALRALLRECVADEPSASPLGRLVALVRGAVDAHAEAGHARVVALLDRAPVWASDLFQGHALLASAWLQLDAAEPRSLFRKRRALARLLDLTAQPARWRRDLPRLPGALDDAEIEAIVARAREFLERMDEAEEAPAPA